MSKVAVLMTRPETVLEDYKRLMKMAGSENALPKDETTCLKINISWEKYFPACSTAPWQLEGVIKALMDAGYDKDRIKGVHNRTVVVNAEKGETANRHKPVLEKYGIANVHLYRPEIEWVRYEPKGKMLVLDKIFPEGIKIPKFLMGTNIIHLPTVKTHVFTTITGAMKNAFGGLLNEHRHWTHSVIHETLVDLLTIQKEIHKGIFAVMDGTFAGEGPGPRCMTPHVKNVIIASADQVAIDAVSAKIQGFDPLKIDFIRLAHEKGLGCGDIRKIEIVGEDISRMNFGFCAVGGGRCGGKECPRTFASKGQHMIYHGWLKPFEKFLLRTAMVPWSYVASRGYHDFYWYPLKGRKIVKEMLKTEWGKLFLKY